MWTAIDTLWDSTKILEYLPKKAKIQILIENPDLTFISETRTKGISNRPWPNDYNGIMNSNKEESLISSQFLKNQKKSKASHFLIFYSTISLKTFKDLGAYIRAL